MEVVPNRLRMESQTVLTQYIIKNWTLDYVDQDEPSRGITMVIVFRRRIMNAILTIYLPTILVLCIVYATNFFKEFFFEAIVTVNLTALLVLTTLFISVSSALPSTAYVKMVDVWLIFAQLVPWVEVCIVCFFRYIIFFCVTQVLLHTAMEETRPEEGARNINHHGKIIQVEDIFRYQTACPYFQG